jgi:hypothetical protein
MAEPPTPENPTTVPVRSVFGIAAGNGCRTISETPA